jgi:hypothetical protein
MLLTDEESRHRKLIVGHVSFTLAEMESCVRLD